MKKLFFVMAILVGFASHAQNFDSFGKKIKAKNALPITQIDAILKDNPQANAKLVGEVESVCQVKGCWMKLKLDNGQTMRVTFKDYGFFVPKDITGKKVIVEGIAKVKTTSVDELKHFAEDAGKSKTEIDKITEPEKAIGFVAEGVLVEN